MGLSDVKRSVKGFKSCKEISFKGLRAVRRSVYGFKGCKEISLWV